MKVNNTEQKENENQNMINNSNSNINININNDTYQYSLKQVNKNFIINIILILSSMNKLEKEINDYLKASLNQNQKGDSRYYLIKNNFIFQLKTLCGYNQIVQYFNKLNNDNKENLEEIFNNKNIINSILSNKKEINSIFNDENYKIEQINFASNFYLNNFYIINLDLLLKLGKINNNINLIQNNEIYLGYNSGKIVLNKRYSQDKNNENNNYCLFIYSLEQNFSDLLEYKIHSILIYSNINDMNNHFSKLINEEKLETYLTKINQNKNDNIKYLLIDKKEIKENLNENIEDRYILYNIFIFNEYSILEQKDIKFFLINRDFMQELESLLCYNEIKQFLNNNQINTLNIYHNKEEKLKIINAVKNMMNENLIQRIKNINNINFEIKLSAHKILNIQKYIHKNSNIFYFYNCQVINKKIFSFF